MYRFRFVYLALALCCLFSVAGTATAAEVDCDAAYCFTSEDFSEDERLAGICITQLPDADTGTVFLGSRVIRSGDILTADQLSQMTFSPLYTEDDRDAVVTYLPIYPDRVDVATTMSIAVRGKLDHAPVAEDFSVETYKNLANQGALKVSDPEGKALNYTLMRKPKRGQVILNTDGTFQYTPKKNKVGVDSFTYTATDPAGNVSREATVTIQILKPVDSKQYTDTAGRSCQFAAEWLRNTGLFAGESLGGHLCFRPDATVSRGDFVAMVVQALDIPTNDATLKAIPSDTPMWLRPYLAAAIRSGLTAGLPASETGSFEADRPITGAEAAVMLQNALELAVSQETLEAVQTGGDLGKENVPTWAASSLTAMEDNGIMLGADTCLTRAEAAELLYQVHQMKDYAPGMTVIRMHRN